jgi:translation initiation factor IF-3
VVAVTTNPSSSSSSSSSSMSGQGWHQPDRTSSYLHDAKRNLSSSTRKRNTDKGGDSSGKKSVLANEDLVARLVRTSTTASSADSLMVRLVIDEGLDNPPTVQVISLSEAIQVSLDRMTDLFGVNLDSDPPVVRAAVLSKLEYKYEQTKKRQKQQSLSTRKEKKVFQFKAGIGTADLDRKIGQLLQYLEKGHECEYTVFTRARTMRDNQDAGIQLVERIRMIIGDAGSLKKEMETNETNTHYRVVMEPKKSSS